MNFAEPTENLFLKDFLAHNHLKVVKARSSGLSTVVELSEKIKKSFDKVFFFLDNGKLYGMGENHHGQLGIRKNVGIVLDRVVNEPIPVVDVNLKGKKVVDFDLGGNSLLILTGFVLNNKKFNNFSYLRR